MSRPESELERRPGTVAYDLEIHVVASDNEPGEADGGYALEGSEPEPPPLQGLVATVEDAEDLVDRVLADLLIHARNCVAAFGDFHLALAPSAPLEPLYRRLMYDPRYRSLPWPRTHLWVQFDRTVPLTDRRSGSRLIEELIALPADIPAGQFHRMPVDDEDPAGRYAQELRAALEWREPGHDRLDYALLALEADGGSEGLRTGTPAVSAPDLMVETDGIVTTTVHLLNAARFVAVLACGAANAPVLQRIAHRRVDPAEAPLAALDLHEGSLKWYLDAAACSAGTGLGHEDPGREPEGAG